MTVSAEIQLWGRAVGAVAQAHAGAVATFQYNPAFAASGIQVAPIKMPLSAKVHQFPELNRKTFHGLPGMLADSLPDKFGNALIDAWLAKQGRAPEDFSAIERLCYTGSRGMGALEYMPTTGPVLQDSDPLNVERLVALASNVLSQQSSLVTRFESAQEAAALKDILRVGTSAGGARAKAVIAWNPQTNEVRSGQVDVGSGFEYWLMKFDGVSGNKDKELEDPQGYGSIEYAYYLMAKDAGIQMMPCRLFEEGGRRHFMTLRFDRDGNGKKVHMQSLAALGHFDFNAAGAHSYEQAFQIMRQLGLPQEQVEQQYLRMLFNVVARNQDDHVKNIAFLMDKAGRWSLSPAFDMTYSYNPQGAWTSAHQMTINLKSDHFSDDDFKQCARLARLPQGRYARLLEQVRDVVAQWPQYAERAAVPAGLRQQVQAGLRL